MSPAVRITTLVENTARRPGVLAEHGLSFWIEYNGRRILFDTGQTSVITHNARELGVDLATTDTIVISHGHYDHTGGLPDVYSIASRPEVCLHSAALAPKYGRREDGDCRAIGIPESARAIIQSNADGTLFTERLTKLASDLYVTGEIPRANGFEDVGGRFFLDPACSRPDPLIDDQALYFATGDGVVILLGCAHAGVINTIRHIQHLTGGSPVRAVIGGMHLGSASPQRLDATMAALREHNLELIAPAHCTGARAAALLWSQFPDQCAECAVGSRFVFG